MEESKSFLILSQNDIFEALTATWDSCQSVRKLSAVQAKIIRVDELKTEFDQLRRKILLYNSKTSDRKEQIDTKTNAFNDLFEAIYGRFLDLKHADESNQSNRSQSHTTPPINLQPLKLVNFNGEIEKWQQFKGLYDSLIHENTSLPKIQKLHYLKSHIFGEAAALIQNIEIQEENYDLCYDLLVERYSSSRRLINFYTGQLLQFDARDAKNYDRFLTIHFNAVKALKNLHLDDLADCLLFQLSYRNLTPMDRQAFDTSLPNDEIPTTEELFKFLRKRLKTNELQEDLSFKTSSRTTHVRSSFKKGVSLISTKSSTPQINSINCGFCKGDHRIYSCISFLELPVADRKKWILQNRRCTKCLGNHLESKCLSKASCKQCNSSSHHSLLHYSDSVETPQCSLTRSTEETILLGTIQIFIKNRQEQWIKVRGILDTASQVNLITSECIQKLGLRIRTKPRAISGVSSNISKTLGTTRCVLDLGDRSSAFTFMALDNICSSQPNFVVPQNVISKFEHLDLADDEFHNNNQIDVLLGAEIVSQLMSKEEPCFIPGNPAALRTKHGYVLMGKIDALINSEPTSLQITNDELNEEMRRFWELENINVNKFENPEDVYCENLFSRTHTRDEYGRYQVRLPIKPNSPLLTSNRNRVYANYLFLEKRLATNPKKKESYDQFLTNYLKSDFMEIAKTKAQYLHNHHAVMKDSSSTSLRVVINGSTPDSNNVSLNSILYTGPKLQATLPNVIDQFRAYEFVVVADISKMFNQILIHPDDRIHQHIFWRPPHEKPVLEFEIKRLSFGHVSSPWLALRVIKQLIKDEGACFPKASFSLDHCTYVDDVLTGANSLKEAKCLIQELIQLLNKGGFELKKWISNCTELLSELSDNDLETPRTFTDDSSYFKVLGITWLPKNDVFSFNTLQFEGSVTKRNIMSYVARLFDPCGWCAPVVLKAKTFIQRSWCLGISWDEEIPDPLASQWTEFVKDFKVLQKIKIPRNIFVYNAKYRLLGFSDGSCEAYGCCVYLQAISSVSSKCQLLRAKSKVCPLRTVSIPRIELMAAQLLVKLMKSILQTQFPFSIENVFYFSDSEIVLHWINSPPHTLKTFVANRTTEILELSSPSQWRHVSSRDNPSDPISRGLQPSQLVECALYWNGPAFLSKPVNEWPSNPALSSDIAVPEMKNQTHCLNVCTTEPFINVFLKYSSLAKLQNVMAYVKRFVYNCKNNKQKYVGPLTVKERKDALLTCAKLTQESHFSKELAMLRKNKAIPGVLQKLSPFIEAETGLIRAGGRLNNSNLHYNSKHPILLPKNAHLSTLICSHFHVTSLHSGVNVVQSLVQKQWWIFGLRNLLRKCIFSCLKCYRLKAKPQQPLMADLPAARSKISKVFCHVGTDFCGPFTIKESRRRNSRTSKTYLCIFVCLCTKAVHLELVTELSTAAFMACFDRFVSRRSLPSCVYSDRGTNYQGARNVLKEVTSWLEDNKEDLYSHLASRQIEWKFSPPNAPNFGGIWESVVKAAKTLLMRTVGNITLTFEELTTVFTKIEAILNSRPLTPLSATPNDDTDFLTPGHFLVGDHLISVPEESIPNEIPTATRWVALKQLTQNFWRRWSREYLQTLLPRNKWTSEVPNVAVGQIVYIARLKTTPLSWPLGRISATHPGKDGVVRVVTVKTANGNYIRPVNTLVPLP